MPQGAPRHASHQARRSRAFLGIRPTTWSLLVPVVALLAGALFATSSTAAAGGSLRYDNDSIADLIRRGTAANADNTVKLDALQAQVDALTKSSSTGSTDVERLKVEADALASYAGRTEVTGPAVEVTLNDSPLKSHELPTGFSVDDIVVHQQDVQAVVNALWQNGAEAMMLMDQRVISTSAVRCVGNTLILQGRVYSPPFVISVIGDPAALEAALDADPTIDRYREYVSALGLGYAVERTGIKTFPAFAGTLSLTSARVAD